MAIGADVAEVVVERGMDDDDDDRASALGGVLNA